MSYASAIAANLVYFSIWEPERTINTLSRFGIADLILVELFGSMLALVWAFGAFVGFFCLVFQRWRPPDVPAILD
jgi:hypothetical protein